MCEGYEIHMGQTVVDGVAGALDGRLAGGADASDRRGGRPVNFPAALGELPDGYRLSERCWGTYMHGILDNQAVVKQVLGVDIPDYRAFRERQYDRLAEHIRANIDLEYIYSNLRL